MIERVDCRLVARVKSGVEKGVKVADKELGWKRGWFVGWNVALKCYQRSVWQIVVEGQPQPEGMMWVTLNSHAKIAVLDTSLLEFQQNRGIPNVWTWKLKSRTPTILHKLNGLCRRAKKSVSICYHFGTFGKRMKFRQFDLENEGEDDVELENVQLAYVTMSLVKGMKKTLQRKQPLLQNWEILSRTLTSLLNIDRFIANDKKYIL